MFISKNRVRMHDTDMAGILYFPRQFRFVHDALEDFVEDKGYSFYRVFHENSFVFVIVHCEADYFAALNVGDALDVHLFIENIGNSSFTVAYDIFREGQKVGAAKTVHVTLERISRKKIAIPQEFRQILEQNKRLQ